ncbi:3696_t:CDS:2, partial [Acaulospora colombiana]
TGHYQWMFTDGIKFHYPPPSITKPQSPTRILVDFDDQSCYRDACIIHKCVRKKIDARYAHLRSFVPKINALTLLEHDLSKVRIVIMRTTTLDLMKNLAKMPFLQALSLNFSMPRGLSSSYIAAEFTNPQNSTFSGLTHLQLFGLDQSALKECNARPIAGRHPRPLSNTPCPTCFRGVGRSAPCSSSSLILTSIGKDTNIEALLRICGDRYQTCLLWAFDMMLSPPSSQKYKVPLLPLPMHALISMKTAYEVGHIKRIFIDKVPRDVVSNEKLGRDKENHGVVVSSLVSFSYTQSSRGAHKTTTIIRRRSSIAWSFSREEQDQDIPYLEETIPEEDGEAQELDGEMAAAERRTAILKKNPEVTEEITFSP